MSDELPHGQRFKALRLSELTKEQRQITDRIASGPAKRVAGPWNAFLRVPELANILEQLSRYVRFNTLLSESQYEFVVLIMSRHLTAQYPWWVHKPAALKEGIAPSIVDQIEKGVRPDGLTEEQIIIYDFCIELLREKDVSDATFANIVRAFGEKGVIQLSVLLGYYNLISNVMFVDRFLPHDGSLPLKPLLPSRSATMDGPEHEK